MKLRLDHRECVLHIGVEQLLWRGRNHGERGSNVDPEFLTVLLEGPLQGQIHPSCVLGLHLKLDTRGQHELEEPEGVHRAEGFFLDECDEGDGVGRMPCDCWDPMMRPAMVFSLEVSAGNYGQRVMTYGFVAPAVRLVDAIDWLEACATKVEESVSSDSNALNNNILLS